MVQKQMQVACAFLLQWKQPPPRVLRRLRCTTNMRVWPQLAF
jgi:hypothetical protein